MDKPFAPSDSIIDGVQAWNWHSCDSDVLCADFVRAVAEAERAVAVGDAPRARPLSTKMLSYWQWALALAEEVRRREPTPHPTPVEDALARVDDVAERFHLRPARMSTRRWFPAPSPIG